MWLFPRVVAVLAGGLLLSSQPWECVRAQDGPPTSVSPWVQPSRPSGSVAGQRPALGFTAEAQGTGHFVTPQGHLRDLLTPDESTASLSQMIQPSVPGPGRAFFLSALLPGLGQRTMGQDRWIAYVAGEAWAWIQFFQRRREGHDLQDRYRDLAWLVARRVSSGPRVDGNFEYYEAMTNYSSSGAYDADPGTTGVQPEESPETYNGSIWLLARQIFSLDDPENPVGEDSPQYEDALRYYRSRAYTQAFAWNWSGNALQQGEFSALIRSSDENLRRSTTMIGVILANHLLSAVDALVSGRLGQVSAPEPRLAISLLPGPFHRDTFLLTVRIPSY